MNNTVKISLNIELQGSTLVRKSKPELINYVVTAKDVDNTKKFRGKDGLKVIRKGSTEHYSYDIKPATLHINISMDAYNYMSSSECPTWINQRDWKRLSKTKRIEVHMQRICEFYNGKSFNYEILDE